MKGEGQQRPSDAEAIEARAAAWLAQRDDGFSQEQAREFAAWRNADRRHAAAVARLEMTWRLLQGLREHADEFDRPAATARVEPISTWRWSPWWVGAAAVLAVATSIFVFRSPIGAGNTPVATIAPQIYTTPSDGYERETLADGSVVELNGNTQVQVAYSPAERRVRLVRGEAHFTVAKNKHRPFWVEAQGVSVRAVGTAFNVRLDPQRVDVLVTEGRVQVAQTASGRTAVAVPELAAGERASIPTTHGADVAVEKISLEAMREALAWRSGPRLDFSGTPLAEVVRQFNRRNRVQLELGDPTLGSEPVGGSFRAENVEAFVDLLTSERDIVADRPSADRIVLRKAK